MKDEIIKKAQESLNEKGVSLESEDVTLEEKSSRIKVGYKDGFVEVPVSQNIINEAVKYLVGAAIMGAGVFVGKVLFQRDL